MRIYQVTNLVAFDSFSDFKQTQAEFRRRLCCHLVNIHRICLVYRLVRVFVQT
jgi:hypothetical protein